MSRIGGSGGGGGGGGGAGLLSERSQPRLGAFEVSFKLVNTESRQTYGPVQIFSKISTGHWPGAPAKLIKRAQESLQPYLAKDMGAGLLFQHARAEVTREQESSPPRRGKENTEAPRSAPLYASDLPDDRPEPPAAPASPVLAPAVPSAANQAEVSGGGGALPRPDADAAAAAAAAATGSLPPPSSSPRVADTISPTEPPT